MKFTHWFVHRIHHCPSIFGLCNLADYSASKSATIFKEHDALTMVAKGGGTFFEGGKNQALAKLPNFFGDCLCLFASRSSSSSSSSFFFCFLLYYRTLWELPPLSHITLSCTYTTNWIPQKQKTLYFWIFGLWTFGSI